MRMRPWLESAIDSNRISGLVWVNKVKQSETALTLTSRYQQRSHGFMLSGGVALDGDLQGG